MVGLPDNAVKESQQRIDTALKQNGYKIPGKKIVINMSPADIRKEGTAYDLNLAIGILIASEQIKGVEKVGDYYIMGELSLDGRILPIRGALPIAIEARKRGMKGIIVPADNAHEAAIVSDIEVLQAENIREVIDFFDKGKALKQIKVNTREEFQKSLCNYEFDFADVKGQNSAKEAIKVAVAGGHNILMIGTPGSGKTMLARRIPSILPPLTVEEALEVSRIHSVAGEAKCGATFVTRRPFRAPHHTVSAIGLLGGGAHSVPGEVSLAHRGVLFLDEFAEFPRHALEVLRQPLEDGHVVVSRAAAAYDYPSKFMLVAAMNPCPCGHRNDPTHDCTCRQSAILKYQSRVSGPILDRIDIQIEVPPVAVKDLPTMEPGEPSAEIRKRVMKARALQAERYRDMPGVHTNADVRSRDLVRVCRLSERERDDLVRLIERLNVSARAYDKILRVARTLADIKGHEGVGMEEIANAIAFRKLDDGVKSFWL